MDNNSVNDEQQKDEQDRIDAFAMAQLKSSQTLLTIAVIAGPVSLILGGVLLSTIAFVCALVGYSKIKKVMAMPTSTKGLSDTLRRQSLICIVVCSAVLVINIAFFAQMVSMYMDYIANGDVQGLMDAIYGTDVSAGSSASSGSDVAGGSSSAGSDSNSGGSIWDK